MYIQWKYRKKFTLVYSFKHSRNKLDGQDRVNGARILYGLSEEGLVWGTC